MGVLRESRSNRTNHPFPSAHKPDHVEWLHRDRTSWICNLWCIVYVFHEFLTKFIAHSVCPATVYLPVYFQACKDSSPIGSGVNVLAYSLSIAPFAIVAGGTATAMNKYKPQNVIAWAFIAIGMGLQSTLHADSSTRNWIGFQIIAGMGFGMLVRTLIVFGCTIAC